MPKSKIPFAGFKKHARLREAIARIVPGLEQLADIDVAKREFHIKQRVLHTPEFGTKDGKAHFVVTAIPAAMTSPEGAHPLRLATVRSEGQFNSIIYEERDSYRGGAERWSVLLSPADLAAFGIAEGQRITLASATGRMEGVIAHAFDLPRGSALAYYPEANVLTGTAVDPRSKTPAFKSVPVWIER
jgi:anaerobic selenocysteine-containing dehydrogenase